MPETDNIELCRRIRTLDRARYCYVILLTALHRKANYLEAMTTSADEFMSKPYDPDELRARIRVTERIIGLQDQLNNLEGVLPTCIYCKKIRDERSQ